MMITVVIAIIIWVGMIIITKYCDFLLEYAVIIVVIAFMKHNYWLDCYCSYKGM